MSYSNMAWSIGLVFFITVIFHVSASDERESNRFLIALRWLLYISVFVGIASVLFFDGDSKTFVLGFMCTFIGFISLFAQAFAGTGGSGGYKPSSNSYQSDSIDYVPQRLGGNGWLNIGNTFSNLNSAIASVESSRRFHPNDRFRVAERRNGRIVGTAYSC